MYAMNIVVGRLGQDIQLHYTKKQMPVCTLNVAETRARLNERGQWENRAVWHQITATPKVERQPPPVEVRHEPPPTITLYRPQFPTQ